MGTTSPGFHKLMVESALSGPDGSTVYFIADRVGNLASELDQ